MILRSLLAFGLVLLAAAPAGAIIRRHDVDDALYREAGEAFRPYIAQLSLPNGAGQPRLYDGMGTVIAPGWILTAAHVAVMFEPGHADSIDIASHWIWILGRGYRVKKAFVRPGYPGEGARGDIALLQLDRAPAGMATACLYRGRDELGQVVINAGMGITGDGEAGVGRADGALRAGTATVDLAEDDLIGWTFRAPDDPRVTPLEGISGPGDSGGPAFVMVDGKPCIIGVSSSQRTMGGSEGQYGVQEIYARVSEHAPWIEQTMAENPLPAPTPTA